MNYVEVSAKTIEEAIDQGLKELSILEEEAEIVVLEEPSKGFLGILGVKQARVKLIKKEKEVKDLKVKEESESDEEKRAYTFLRDLLNGMDVKAEIKIRCEDKRLFIELIGPRMGMIIGRRGQTLDSIQYLVNLVVNKNRGREEYYRVILDTEDYRKKREETLKRLAKRLADRALKNNRRMELEPMNPYERRIIHSALQGYPGVYTYSEGEEPYRKVVIACK